MPKPLGSRRFGPRLLRLALALAFVLPLFAIGVDIPASAQGADDRKVILVLDASGSMSDWVNEGRKIDIAAEAVTATLNTLGDQGREAEVLVFEDCQDLTIPQAWNRWKRDWDPSRSVNTVGSTPTGLALQAAMYRLGYIDADGLATGGGTGEIVLISDGMSNCPPDPCKVVEDAGTPVVVHTVGFLLAASDRAAGRELRCIAQITGGIFVSVEKAEEAVQQIPTLVREQNVHNHPKNVPQGLNERYSWWRYIDRDGDGIPDKWEEDGVYFPIEEDGVVVSERWLDLAAAGADPDVKDIFIYWDWEQGAQFDDAVFDLIADALAEAPFDSNRGIDVHFIRGKEIPSSELPTSRPHGSSTTAVREALFKKAAEYSGFDKSMWSGSDQVPQLAKYLLLLDHCESCVYGVVYSIPGNFMTVLLGGSSWCTVEEASGLCDLGPNINNETRSQNFVEASVVVHELGHLLGLRHHGTENCPVGDDKYQSVMSYKYALTGLPTNDGESVIDYSRETTVNLDWKLGRYGGTKDTDTSCNGYSSDRYPNAGSITFVLGQYGEDPDFYSTDADLRFGPGQAPPEVDIESLIRETSRQSLTTFVEYFDLEYPTELLGPCAIAPPAPFVDVSESSFAFDDIACIYDLGITRGTSTYTYSPRQIVTREQMAAFMAHLYQAAVEKAAPTARVPFRDIDSSFAKDAIGQIYGLDITRGTGPGTYSPRQVVTREQMAAFMARLYRAIVKKAAPTVPVPFTDVGSSFAKDAIGQIYGLDITRGTGPGTYSPRQVVTREQMAAFMARLYRIIDNETR